jgi:basic membrane protein A
MKKFLAMLLALVMALSLVACGEKKDDSQGNGDGDATAAKVKVGFITLHDENSTYDLNFINAAKEAIANLGLTDADYILKTNIPEGQECYEAAVDMVDQGCNIIFADSFGHEPYMLQAAQEFPEVQFCHSTGTLAHTANVANYHNAFASIYEGRYLAGIAAGLKLNEMIENGTEINGVKVTADNAKIGYVGAFTYAEVVSGYTSFFLGARSVCPSVTMEVTFTGSWYDEALEKEGAQLLINNGCNLISQHADSLGAPTACQNAGVPNVSYNGSTEAAGPDTYIISSRINWAPYYEYAIKAVMNGETIDADWTGTLATGSVVLTDVNAKVAAAGTQEAIDAAKAKLESGELHVFDCATFTTKADDTMNTFKVDTLKVDADGHITSYLADVDTDEAYTGDTEVIKDGYFAESEFRSAPYFDLQIDGITLLNTKM